MAEEYFPSIADSIIDINKLDNLSIPVTTEYLTKISFSESVSEDIQEIESISVNNIDFSDNPNFIKSINPISS